MSKNIRTFKRPLGERRYKKLFIVSVEGSKTEPQYFDLLNQPQSIVLVKCLKRQVTKSSPTHVLKRMKDYLSKESLKKSDEAWIVVDKDEWSDDQLNELVEWTRKSENYGLGLSNPLS